MKVLYIDGVGAFGGASRSLFEALWILRAKGVEPHFVTARGTIVDYYGKLAVDHVVTVGLFRFDNTAYSHYRGRRWVVFLREVFHLPFTVAILLRARLRWRHVDVIHVNEIVELFPALAAKWLFRAPLVVHVRSVQRSDPRSWRTRLIAGLLRRYADAVIAIDETVRESLPADVCVDVVHNSFAPGGGDAPDAAFRARLNAATAAGGIRVGFVGNLQAMKGLFELVEAAGILKDEGVVARVLIVGDEVRRGRGFKAWVVARLGLSQEIKHDLLTLSREREVADRVHFLGETRDILAAYEAFDVLCFPSHLNACGRPVFEAAFSGIPSIVALADPKPDTLVPGETGLAIPARDSRSLATAIRQLALDPAGARRMGENARALARANFDPATNAEKIWRIYHRMLADRSDAA